ncbi:MAG: MarR family transcriptional regulator [Candidatus Korobacteraceae bacterium]
MSTHDLKSSDYAALADFRYQIRRFLHFSEQAARRAGVEPQHHQLMLAIRGAGSRNGSRIADLAERLQIQHHSAVELVSRLEEKGLIQRNRSAEDRREVYVSLTSHGEEVLRELTLHHREELRSAAPALIAALRRVNGRANRRPAKRTAKPRARAEARR